MRAVPGPLVGGIVVMLAGPWGCTASERAPARDVPAEQPAAPVEQPVAPVEQPASPEAAPPETQVLVAPQPAAPGSRSRRCGW